MDDFFDPNGKMMELLWKPVHIMFLNLLWVVFSLPVVTMGASTTALYSVLIKMRNGKEGKLFSDFWEAFRSNFCQSTAIWLIILVAGYVFTTDIFYFLNMGGSFGTVCGMLFLGLDVALVLMGLYVFPLQAVFDNTIGVTMKSALYLSSKHILWTVILLVFNVLAAIGIWLYWILIGWIAFGLVGYINAWIFDRIFRRYYPQEEA